MAYWPKTLRGNVLTVLLIVVGIPLAVIGAIALSGPLVWEHARERAWVGTFSFGDMIESMRAREALDHPVR